MCIKLVGTRTLGHQPGAPPPAAPNTSNLRSILGGMTGFGTTTAPGMASGLRPIKTPHEPPSHPGTPYAGCNVCNSLSTEMVFSPTDVGVWEFSRFSTFVKFAVTLNTHPTQHRRHPRAKTSSACTYLCGVFFPFYLPFCCDRLHDEIASPAAACAHHTESTGMQKSLHTVSAIRHGATTRTLLQSPPSLSRQGPIISPFSRADVHRTIGDGNDASSKVMSVEAVDQVRLIPCAD